ncbi:MAG: hypothetical protein K6A23_03985 [Butyrivibrio sp.]|nr:hypothetical protein [Butyrivibrio sp.]
MTNNLFDLAIFLGGAYMIYCAINMKANNVLKAGVIIPVSIHPGSIKDKEGLKAYTYPRLLGQGIAMVIMSAIGIFCDLLGFGMAHLILYIVVLVGYVITNRKFEQGKSKFY